MKTYFELFFKLLLALPLFLLWILVFLMFLEKRNQYYLACQNNAKYLKTENKYGLVSEHTYYFDPNKKPEKEYPTWKEFWERFGYYNLIN